MLDVDRKVIGAPELVLRVRELLRTTETGAQGIPNRGGRRYSGRPSTSDGLLDVSIIERRARAVQQKQAALRPPDITASRGGLTGRGLRNLKRVVRKLSWWYVEPRWQVQTQIDAEMGWIASETAAGLHTLAAHQSQRGQQVDELRAEVAAAATTIAELRDDVGRLQGQLGEAAAMMARQVTGAPPAIDYPAFEELFRGSSEQVRATQADYVPYFGPADPDDRAPIVDIGCGRGEMLTLLAEAGHRAVGVELDADMVARCEANGLDVVHASAVPWLAGGDDAALKGVFCAQVVEHLPTAELARLVKIVAEKLRPGGTFVAETIDPRSAHAVGNHFWADPTHVRPVHPATLAYLCRAAGFSTVDVLPRSRHEAADLLDDAADDLPEGREREALRRLLDSVYGYQDYALVARR